QIKAELAAKNAAPSPAAKPTKIANAATNPTSAGAAKASPAAGGGTLLGKVIPEFSASAVDNTSFQSKDQREKVLVVAFMGVQCPLANLYYPNLVSLASQFKGQSVAFVIVNSNEQDTLNTVREQAKTHQAKFPVLKDAGNQVADLFGASRTPELFILDESRAVRYHGQIDDQYGYQARRKAPSRTYASDAIKALLEGGSVTVAETPLQGCHIGRKEKAAEQSQTSFYRDVLPILQNRCQQCHRAGDIGPFSLEDYATTSNWGETIKESVTEKRMPPWPADPEHGKFLNNMRLPDTELKTLVKWVDEGCPEGNAADAPPAKTFVDGWNIGKPDQEFAMDKAFEVPATGVVDYQHFVVSPVFTKDVWVQAVECRYGNRSVVHHMLALLHFPKDRERSQDGLRNGFFAAGAPGSNYLVFPPGHAKRIPKGAQLVLQMHYTPSGSPTRDQSRLGVVLAKQPPEFEVLTYAIGTEDILVKAGDPNYTKTYSEPIDRDVTLTTLMPHLHLRGKAFDIEATSPDGKTEKLISIPKWDFNWQFQYQLAEPITLPKGSKITVTAAWDNSDKNPNNILPPVDVRFGEQTFDEMFIGYVNYVIPRKAGAKGKTAGRSRG
ncbi:MAG: redoxin domain-containing protein, partial [Planctomycetaceae bacterium]